MAKQRSLVRFPPRSSKLFSSPGVNMHTQRRHHKHIIYIVFQMTTLLGWSAAAVLAMLLVYGPHKSILPGAEEWNEAENVLYGTFHRFLWGLVLVWVTYACHYGAGG